MNEFKFPAHLFPKIRRFKHLSSIFVVNAKVKIMTKFLNF